MANGRVDMAVRAVKRQCRTLWISAQQNTSECIADDSPPFSWLLRFAAQVMNIMRIGKDGKHERSEKNRTKMEKTNGTIWREKVWLRKMGEDGVSSFASCITQGIFVGHHDRRGAVVCIAKNGGVRGKSWTRQPLNDAWNATNWNGLCGAPWQTVAPELKLTKKVTADRNYRDPHCQGLWLKEF